MKKLLLPILFSLSLLTASSHAENSRPAAPRLISTDAFITELLFALDADQHLIAVDVTSKLPANYRPLANIGYHRTLSAEGILNLQPTQVIGSEHIGPPAVLSALNKANVEVLKLPSALSSEQLRSNIHTLAEVVDRKDNAEKLLALMDSQLNLLKQNTLANQRIAFLLSMDPSKLRLAGSNTSGDALIGLTQGSNVATFNNYRNVSAESLLALAPDIIVVAGRNADSAVNEVLAANPILKYTPAGKNSNIIAVDGSTLIAGLSPAAIDEALVLVKRINNISLSITSTKP
ncbi:MAG: ABC transporter substrate-binding protein [Pseudomonadales bacterium]